MNQVASGASLTQAEIDTLNGDYKNFIDRLKRKWLQNNNSPPKHWTLYELDAQERTRVDGVIRGWEQYVTPLAERWWRRRGFGIRWPEKSSDPCQIYKLETASAA